jgi:hypothetical protein
MSPCSPMHCVSPSSKPPDGGKPPSFRPIAGGTQLRGSWHLSAIVRLQGFSSDSPAAPLGWGSPETVTTSSRVGRSKPDCDLGPTLSFKDVHHPCWGGCRTEPALRLPHGFVGHPLPRYSREKALTGPAGSADFDNVGWIGGERRHLQRVGSASSAPVGLFVGGRLPRRVHGRSTPDTARRKGGVRVLGWPCFCTRAAPSRGGRCPTHRGGFEWGSGGRLVAPGVSAKVEAAREVPVSDGITATIGASGLRLFALVLAPRVASRARARQQLCLLLRPAPPQREEPEFRL